MEEKDIEQRQDEEVVEDESVVEEPEESVDEPEIDETEQVDDTSEPAPQVEPPKEERPRDWVPLPKYMEERSKRQKIERERELERMEAEERQLVQDMTQRGWPEEEAKHQAKEKMTIQRELAELKQERQKAAVQALSKSDEFYADADIYADEITRMMRDKSLDAEEAYMALRGKTRRREMQVINEQRSAVSRKDASAKKVTSGQATATKDPYPLNASDMRALKGLQQAQPEANWTREKFHKMVKSLDQQ